MDLQIHLCERLVHVLHMHGCGFDQAGAVAAQRADGAYLGVGAEGGIEQADRVKILQPLAVLHVGFTAGYMLDVFGVDQADAQPGRLQYLVGRNQIHPG